MSLETELKKNTEALNANTEILQKLYELKTADVNKVPGTATEAAPPVQPAPVAAPVQAAPPAQPAPVAAPVQPADVVPPTPAPVAARTPDEMNATLVAEFKRIGSRDPIDAVLNNLGFTSVTQVPADKQQEIITAIAAIPSAS